MSLHHFLLIYDLRARRLVNILTFTNAEEATAAYGQAEREHLDDRETEIVLVGSDSLETVKRTHAQYFNDNSHVDLPELVSS